MRDKDKYGSITLDTYALAMENAPVGFQIFELVDPEDIGTFTFRFANKSCEQQTGMDIKKFVGLNLYESVPALMNTRVPKLYKQALDSQKTVDVGILEYGDKLIEHGFYKVQAYPIDEIHIGVVFFNVTAQVHAEKELKTKSEEVEQKNLEMEQITYIASHDLQEPLNTIKSMSEWLQSNYADKIDERGKKGFQFVVDATGRMKALIQDLMGFSKIGKGGEFTANLNVAEIIQEIRQDLNAIISEKNAKFRIGEMPKISGMKTEIRLIFQNLISNAIKFQLPSNTPIISIQSEENETHWQFCVSDNGIGLPAKSEKKIFAIFKRLNNSKDYSGTGIGLAHCKKVVEMHKGTIWVKSEPGKGSDFYFTILKSR